MTRRKHVTIGVTKEVKDKLFQIKVRLEKERSKRVSYSAVIDFLLERASEQKV